MASSRAFGFDARRLILVEPGARPHHLASVEKCDRQIGFKIEVSVKAGLGTARPGQDSIDADLVDPVRTEQIVGRIEDALGVGRASGSLRSQVRSIANRGTPLGKVTGASSFLVVTSSVRARQTR